MSSCSVAKKRCGVVLMWQRPHAIDGAPRRAGPLPCTAAAPAVSLLAAMRVAARARADAPLSLTRSGMAGIPCATGLAWRRHVVDPLAIPRIVGPVNVLAVSISRRRNRAEEAARPSTVRRRLLWALYAGVPRRFHSCRNVADRPAADDGLPIRIRRDGVSPCSGFYGFVTVHESCRGA